MTLRSEPIARFQSAEQFPLSGRGTVYVVMLDRPCSDFTWLVGHYVNVNGRTFRCAGVEATPIPKHHLGELIGVLDGVSVGHTLIERLTKRVIQSYEIGPLSLIATNEILGLINQLELEITQLKEYVVHKPTCWLNYKTRDLVPSEGGIRFRREDDAEPTCTCGLSRFQLI